MDSKGVVTLKTVKSLGSNIELLHTFKIVRSKKHLFSFAI